MNNIKQYRKARGISVTELALKLNMSQGNLSKIENGQVDLRTDLAQKIAEVLGCPLERLLDIKEETNNILLQFNLPVESKILVVKDDTMSPILMKNDRIVYQEITSKREDGLYIICQNSELKPRRLQQKTGEEVIVICDNKYYQNQVILTTELNIVGKITHRLSVEKLI